MKIVVVGTDHVGLAVAIGLAELGHDVAVIESDAHRLALLRAANADMYEPGLNEMMARHQATARLTFTRRLEDVVGGVSVVFLAQTCPDAVSMLVASATGPLVVAVCADVRVGASEELLHNAQALAPEHPLALACVPFSLRRGAALNDFLTASRVIIGAREPWAVEVLRGLLRPTVSEPSAIIEMTPRAAELTRLATSAYLATRVSFMNELAHICEGHEIDVTEVQRGLAADPRIGAQHLGAGLGYGGVTLPRDVAALNKLARDTGYPARLLAAVSFINREQVDEVRGRIRRFFGGRVSGRRLAVWGLAYKAETNDVSAAPALALLRGLSADGAHVNAYDPEALAEAQRTLGRLARTRFVTDAYNALEGCEALVIATDWAEFKTADYQRIKRAMARPAIFDTKNVLCAATARKHGFFYVGIGRAAS